MLGPLLPSLSARWALTDVEAGYLFSAQFLGSIAGTLISGNLVSRRGFRIVILAGLALMALAVSLVIPSSASVAIGAIFASGVGLGLVIPSANLLVGTVAPGSTVALNYLNLFWGLGAVGCPFLVAFFQHHSTNIAPFFYVLSIALLVFGVPVFAVQIPQNDRPTLSQTAKRTSIWKSSLLPVLAILFFLYEATENGVAGWIAYQAKRTAHAPGLFWATVPAYFWGALLFGRATGHLLARKFSLFRALRIHLVIAAVGIAVLIASPGLTAIVAGAIAAGLGFSTVFPAFLNILSTTFGTMAPKAGSVLFTLGALGGACGPLAIGVVSEHSSLRAGFLAPIIGCMAMILLCSPRFIWWTKNLERIKNSEPKL